MEITNLDAPPIFDPLNPENCQCDKTVLCLNFPFANGSLKHFWVDPF